MTEARRPKLRVLAIASASAQVSASLSLGRCETAAERVVAAVLSPALAVPASLHASLMARLDRLGPAKEVAQIGAAIGREFSHALLAAVMHKPEGELGSSQNFVLLRSHPRMIAVAEIRRPGARAEAPPGKPH